jgi:YidC/Oxa1 family membrane protein insertase
VTAIQSAIGYVLAVFYSLVPSLGVAIILLTCTVMLLLFPLTAKQTRSMIAMQRVQPEIKKLQQKFKDDKQKQNEEIMRFYQENKINPLSGCLPLLMQMPIFFALFGVLRDIEKHIPTTDRFTDLYTDLCGTDPVSRCKAAFGAHEFLGMDLSVSAGKATGGFLDTLPYFVLVALVIATGWYQARQTMARQSSSGAQMANTQAQIIGKVMPVVFGVLSLNFASGLVVYFVTSNLWRIGQQQLVLNKMYDAAHANPAPKAEPAQEPPADDASAAAERAAAAKAAAARRRKRKKKR